MNKIFKIITFSLVILIFLSMSIDVKGERKDKKNKTFNFDFKDPIGEKIQNRKSKMKSLSVKSSKKLSPMNNNHSLTEVGVWGYGACGEVTIDGNRAYFGSGRMFLVFDISDKSNPVKMGEILLTGHVCEIRISGSFAYVANHYGGLRILNISDPQNPYEVGHLDTPMRCRGIDISGSYAYITAVNDGLRVVDISIPSAPQEVGFYDTPGEANSVLVSGSYAYIGEGNNGALRIIDISNPQSPTESGSCNTNYYPHGMQMIGNLIYLADLGGGLYIIDISDPANPNSLSSVNTQYEARDVAVRGNYAYVAASWAPMEIYDISDPSDPQLVRSYDETEPASKRVTVHGNYIFAGTFQGFRIYDITSPISPQPMGNIPFPDISYGMHISGNYAYIANYTAGLLILDISDKTKPKKVGVFNTPESVAWDVEVSGNYAYLANGWMGLVILNVSNPASPQLTSTCDPSYYGQGLTLSGNFAYLANRGAGLQIIDISNPNSPNTVGTFNTPGNARDVYVSGNYAYVADGESGVRVIDVTTPSAPSEVAFYDTAGFASDVVVHRGNIYVADSTNGLCIIDLPSQVGHYPLDSNLNSIFLTGDYAYLTTAHDGIQILDISAPSSPKLVSSIFHHGLHHLMNIEVVNGYVYANLLWFSTFNVFKHEVAAPTPAEITLNRTQMYFAASSSGKVTGAQSLFIGNNGGAALNWSAACDHSWLSCTPVSGTGSGFVSVSIDTSGLSPGTYNGTITVSDANASNSPQTVAVGLTVYGVGQTVPPFGQFATPVDGSAVSSSIPVTGWALDDIGVESVKIYNGTAYVGDALFVEGARPDVEQAYPGYPLNYRAGWGYMLLTNFLPNGGNGTYTLYAKARDFEGKETTLGSKTITVDNAHAVKPFGAIDTPAQGGTASGKSFVNWGWVLTPQPNSIPTDGSTIDVWVDGVNLGHPTYNNYRADIANKFPGYANSDGAIGYFYLDTTLYANEVHTIQWTARDTGGNTDGIGSRYFTIQNTGADVKASEVRSQKTEDRMEISSIDVDTTAPVLIQKGFKSDNLEIFADDTGEFRIKIRELEPVHMKFSEGSSIVACYLLVGNQMRKMPAGMSIRDNTLAWMPGVAYLGNYQFIVVIKDENEGFSKKYLNVTIEPTYAPLLPRS